MQYKDGIYGRPLDLTDSVLVFNLEHLKEDGILCWELGT